MNTPISHSNSASFRRRLSLLASLSLFLTLPLAGLSQGQPGSAPVGVTPAGNAQPPRLPAALARGILEEEGNLNLRAAVKQYQAVITEFDEQRRFAATALFRLGECYRKLGQTNEAQAQYRRVLREFPDQTQVVQLCQAMAAPNPTETGPSQSDPELERIKALSQESPDLINAVGQSDETLLQTASSKGQIEVARFLLDHGAAVNGLKQPELTPLHFAAGNGHLAVVDLLLRRGANVQAVTESGVMPLHLAALKGYAQVAKALLEAGAPVNVGVRQDVNAERPNLKYNLTAATTPLDIAVGNGYANIVELLLGHGADPNARSRSGGTILHLAAGRGQAAMLELLVRHGANLNGKDSAGATPLHLAAGAGDLAALKDLISAKAEINATNNSGETPLLTAAKTGRRETAEALLTLGADPKLASTTGLTPLHLAVAAGDVVFVRDLLEHGADPNRMTEQRPQLLQPRPYGGAAGEYNYTTGGPITPLELACESGNVAAAKLLLEHGADPNPRRAGVDVPLLALQSVWSNLDLLKLLLEHKANPNLANERSERPLHIVAQAGGTNALALLLDHGADVNARTESGATPLHYAVSSGRLDMVEALVAAKADLNATDVDLKTPLDLVKPNQGGGFGGSGSPQNVRRIPSRRIGVPSIPMAIPPQPASAAPGDIAAALRRAGALEEIPRLDRIEVTRESRGAEQVLFRKDTNDWNHFTLFELIAGWYGLISTSQEWRTTARNGQSDPRLFAMNHSHPYDIYPDFSRIVLRRPSKDGRQWTEQRIDLSKTFASADCTGDIPLAWGDVVNIPEADHPVNEPWPGLSADVLAALQKCLARNLEIIVNGKTNSFTLSPDIDFKADGQPSRIGPQVPIMLRPALLRSSLVPSSSALARVKVTRADPGTGQTREWVLDCSNANTAPDFWLRNGDRIELLEP